MFFIFKFICIFVEKMKYKSIVSVLEVNDTQLSLYENSSTRMVTDNKWDKEVEVEKSSYYWNGDPVLHKGTIHNTSKKPLVVELFCGCGGTSVGFEMAGFDVALGCDILRPAIETFKHNHPKSSAILGDIKKVTPEMIENLLDGKKVDVLVAGVPCQGFSLNNRKRKQDDNRNFLYLEFLRFVDYLEPNSIVVENVSGMKSTGTFSEDIEKSLSLVSGMKVTSKLLYAPDYGVPQKRTRLVFVGTKSKDFSFDDIVKTHGPTTSQEYVTIEQAIGDLPPLSNGEEKFEYGSKATSKFQRLMRKKKGKRLENHRSPKHPKATISRIGNTEPGSPMYPKFKQRIRLSWDGLSPTQVSGGIRPQFQLGHPSDPRGLSIRERCRIQSFPDHIVIKGGTVQARVQTGNAVPPLLAKAVALAIKQYLHEVSDLA
ncbi:DNA cytosine methyltransferase [Neolewinella aurantiaca]|uniref:Cytosine-specific methyltransferase n=1 Tax=Neolewinella aurantiaca TaxID=2602767 RepID=A0A5C7FAQ8_9BACT|nr:DNA cytosine methyltransferase [Neolewinella aurantiaca]TXF87718.1 DNA cytosine methyltransferase [Neolewinella aurantiaca]